MHDYECWERPESPDRLRSRGSLCSSSLTPFVPAVLASPVFPEPVAPFNPPHSRWITPRRVGLKGAALSTNPGEVSTASRRLRSATSRGSRECGGFLVLHSHCTDLPTTTVDTPHPKTT